MDSIDYDYVPLPTELFSFPFVQKTAFQIVARCFSLCWNSREARYEPRLTTMVELAHLCGVGRQTLYDNWRAVLASGFVMVERMGNDTLILAVSERFSEHPPVLAHRVGEDAIAAVQNPYNGGLSLPSSLGNLESSSRTRTTPGVRILDTHGIDSPRRIEDLLIGFGVRLSVARSLSERPGLTYVDALRLIKDGQKRNLGPGGLVLRLLNGDTIPEICEDCGGSLVGTFNDFCPTCAERQRRGYLQYATVDDNAEDEA